jgi:hypothetical protein
MNNNKKTLFKRFLLGARAKLALNISILYNILKIIVGISSLFLLICKPYLFISYLAKIFPSLFFFLLTIFCLDGFKFSSNKKMKYSQILVFLFPLFYFIYVLFSIYFGNYILLDGDIICNVISSDSTDIKSSDITLKGKIVLDKGAGTEIAKGITSLGSNVGLAGCVGALAGSVAKGVAKSSLPPFQKVGLIMGGGIAGAALHVGGSAINAQAQIARNANYGNTDKVASSKDINHFFDSGNDSSPLEILLQSIYILNSVSVLFIFIFSIQLLFKLYVKDIPDLK